MRAYPYHADGNECEEDEDVCREIHVDLEWFRLHWKDYVTRHPRWWEEVK